jgi:hypothetical protein
VIEQLPLATPLPEEERAPVHVSVPPLTVTVTEPVGDALPDVACTLKATVTAWFGSEGSGLSLLIVVVVPVAAGTSAKLTVAVPPLVTVIVEAPGWNPVTDARIVNVPGSLP